MTKQPLVSIIIPTYNRANLIGETLNSIIAQTYKNWECIVVDDDSTDNTEEVLINYTKTDYRIQYHKRPKQYKPGGNGARNYGFDICKGEYINWFDSDDLMLSNFLLDKIDNINDNDIILCSHYIVNENMNILETKNISINRNILYDFLIWGNNFNIVTNNILFNKNYILKNNFRFNENILRGQETDFLLNIFSKKNKTLRYIIINKPLFYYRQHANSKSEENKNKSKRFNYSLVFINFKKLNIAIENNYIDVINDSKLRLKTLSIKVTKDRDYKTMLLIIKELIKTHKIRSIFLAINIFIFYWANKTPNLIYKQWEKIC